MNGEVMAAERRFPVGARMVLPHENEIHDTDVFLTVERIDHRNPERPFWILRLDHEPEQGAWFVPLEDLSMYRLVPSPTAAARALFAEVEELYSCGVLEEPDIDDPDDPRRALFEAFRAYRWADPR